MTRAPGGDRSRGRSLAAWVVGSALLHGMLLFVSMPEDDTVEPGGGGGFEVALFTSEEPAEAPDEGTAGRAPDEPAAASAEPPLPEGVVPPQNPEASAAARDEPPIPVSEPGRPGSASHDAPPEPGEAPGTGSPRGAGGDASNGADASAPRYRPPKLLTIVYPLTLEEAESLPSPLEIEVRLLVGKDGRVLEVEPVGELPASLLESLVRSAREMRFRPAIDHGEPVEAWTTTIVVYRR